MLKSIRLTSTFLFSTLLFFACNEDDNESSPIKNGALVEIRNTLEIAADVSQGGTGGNELPIETVLGAPEGTYNLTNTVSNAIEFDDYLEGLYDIDISESAITFTLVAAQNDPIYSSFFRTIEPGTFDRYYLTFSNDHDITSASSSDNSAGLNIISSNEIVVVIGEGWNFNPGSTFTLSLN